jgi:hypothetical protein
MKFFHYVALLFSLLFLSFSSFAQNYPTCSSASSDPDGDGWGWENNRSCKVATTSGSGNYPNCSNASSDPDGDGWGWENNRSCKVISGSGTSGNNPICTNSSSDPDGDGWGWENNQSCRVANNGTSSSGSCGTGSCPGSLSCPSGMSCGCYTVSGLGANKQAYKNAGANRSFLASAMMETERMDTNYAYGDNKSGDAFNAGATKQNWGMMRQCRSSWRGYGPNDYSVSAAMNNNRSLDVQVYNECRNYYGDQWFAGHRNGTSGLANPYTQDINNFRAGYNWTYNQLAGHECDDVRFWVSIPAI